MLKLFKDYRIGNTVKYYFSEKEVNQMQIPQEIKKCVCFIYYPAVNGNRILLGTGFFVFDEVKENFGFVYCVTAKHILENVKINNLSKNIILRINLTSGESTYISSEIDDWVINFDDDIAVLSFIPTPELDIKIFPIKSIVDDNILIEEEIDTGDEVFITGVFSKYHDTVKIIPILRSGIISAMPHEQIRVNEGLIDGYLIETRSIGGLSGSPVFVNLGHVRYVKGDVRFISGGYKFYLLGVVRGHYEDWKITNSEEEIEKINMGIAIITPGIKILETINYPQLLERKKQRIKELEKEMLPTED